MQKGIRKYINMTEKNMNQEFRLKNINEKKKFYVEKISQNELMIKTFYLSSINTLYNSLTNNWWVVEFWIILAVCLFSFCSYWVYSHFCVASLVGIAIGIKSSEKGLKICLKTVAMKEYESIFTKKKKKDSKIVLLAKSKLNSIQILVFK